MFFVAISASDDAPGHAVTKQTQQLTLYMPATQDAAASRANIAASERTPFGKSATAYKHNASCGVQSSPPQTHVRSKPGTPKTGAKAPRDGEGRKQDENNEEAGRMLGNVTPKGKVNNCLRPCIYVCLQRGCASSSRNRIYLQSH